MPTPLGSGYFTQLDIPDEAFSAYRAGKELVAQHQYAEAINEFSKAVAFVESPPAFRARVFERRGECYWYMGDFAAAGQDYQAALETCDDPGQIARARARLGEVADSTGNFPEAVSLFNTALREGLAAGDLIAIGRAQRGLGIVHRRQGNTDQAISHLSQALAAFRQAGDARHQARLLSSLGRTRHARGEYQAAISELSSDIYRTGIYLTGGGALLRGLDMRMAAKTKLNVHIADDPLRVVVRGTGIALKNSHKYSFLMDRKSI